MSKELRMKIEAVLDFLGEVIAFIAVVIFAVSIVNMNFHFLPENVANIFEVIKIWVGLLLIAVTGLEGTIKRNIVIRIIFYILLAICLVFMFARGTYDTIMNFIPVGK